MTYKIGIGRKQIATNVIFFDTDDMKYPVQTVSLIAGANVITTAITTPVYNVFLLDSTGVKITDSVDISISLVGGIYEITITAGIVLNNVALYIIY
jgi:hypothetical protein